MSYSILGQDKSSFAPAQPNRPFHVQPVCDLLMVKFMYETATKRGHQ
jgi:hypothetical protein